MRGKYESIRNVFQRDPETKHRTILKGAWDNEYFEYLAECPWIWTEKVDGMNIRISNEPMIVGDLSTTTMEIRGRTDKAQLPGDLVDNIHAAFDGGRALQEYEEAIGENVTLYGEGYGAGIQKGGGYRDTKSFILFDVFIHTGEGTGYFLDPLDVQLAAVRLGCDVVPIVGVGTLDSAMLMVAGNLKSRIPSADCDAEGLVCHPSVPVRDKYGKRIMCKIKACDFK